MQLKSLQITAYLFAATFLFTSCNQPNETDANAQLGVINLEVSGSADALPAFEKGLLLLHSFEYEDAAQAFQKAQKLDPNFVMAYWGEAMTCNHSLWREQDQEEGQAILERLGATVAERKAKAKTELEQDLLAAVEVLYGEGSKFERDVAYSKFMEELHQKYPNNHEVGAFYALSLLGSVPYGRDVAVFEKGAGIAQSILKENPNHPGALHYLIHSYDDPAHAAKAITAANSYSKVAPDAAHALHMPSHIYVALGMWDEVIQSNIASWNASVNRMEQKELDSNARSYHALHWLMYGYLQENRIDTSRQLLKDMIAYTSELDSKRARSYLVRMKAAYLCETNDWESEMSNISVDLSQLNISTVGIYYFLEGMKAFKAGQAETLSDVIDTLENKRLLANTLVTDKGIPMCSAGGGNPSAPNQLDVDQVEIMEMELRGLLAWSKKDTESAKNWMGKAVEKEKSISYSYGPPEIVKPSFELMGELLLKLDEPKAAMPYFDEALYRGPERILALEGQLACAKKIGDSKLAESLQERIHAIRKGNESVPQLL